MMRRGNMRLDMGSILVAAVIFSALVVFAGAASFFLWKSHPWIFPGIQTVFPTLQTLRVAIIPLNDDADKFLTALKQEIASEHARVRYSLVETASVWASGQAFKEKSVEAAVVRSDDP